jgi:hypothetical protein
MKFSDLPTLVRRSFLDFLYQQMDAEPDDIDLQRGNTIQQDGQDILIPYTDTVQKKNYVARIEPNGRVTRA